MLGRTALGPHPPGSSRSSLERRKRRFLAYSFPSRSPDPHHLAVLTRPDFVGAACRPHRHHPDRTAPSFTALLRQDQQRRSRTPSRIHSASRRTQRRLKIDPFSSTRGQTTRTPRSGGRPANSQSQLPRARRTCVSQLRIAALPNRLRHSSDIGCVDRTSRSEGPSPWMPTEQASSQVTRISQRASGE